MSTATPLPISISEYPRASYQPDCDYVDGILEQRIAGSPEQAPLQRALAESIERNSRQWEVRAFLDTPVQTSASHVRVADIAILPLDHKPERVIDSAPVAIVEILSQEDHIPRHTDRLEDFRRMGVKSIWAVDSAARKGFDASSKEWAEATSFAVPETPIQIDLAAVFAEMDRHRAL
jgi:Uma2 family endonuclease